MPAKKRTLLKRVTAKKAVVKKSKPKSNAKRSFSKTVTSTNKAQPEWIKYGFTYFGRGEVKTAEGLNVKKVIGKGSKEVLEIDRKSAQKIIESDEEYNGKYEPYGLFLIDYGEKGCEAIDNTWGDADMEEFDSRKKALRWLRSNGRL